MLVLTLRPGDVVRAGDLMIKHYQKSKGSIKLAFDAPQQIKIVRKKAETNPSSRKVA